MPEQEKGDFARIEAIKEVAQQALDEMNNQGMIAPEGREDNPFLPDEEFMSMLGNLHAILETGKVENIEEAINILDKTKAKHAEDERLKESLLQKLRSLA